ncbi:FkbM family methyltransferase, partial [Aeromonas veronii]|nr:FkbM family methyltransferase [Aeromonas veronii]
MNSLFAQYVDLLQVKNQRLMDIIEAGEEFAIFGTGKLAQDCYAKLQSLGAQATYFVDRNEQEGRFCELPLKSIHDIWQSTTPLLIASTWAKAIVQDLKAAGFQGEIFIIDPFVTVFERISDTDKAQLSDFYDLLADDASKTLLTNLLAFRCGDVEHDLISAYPQYLSPDVKYAATDVLLDGGAYIGDTIQSLERHDLCLQEIHAFEPDAENFSKLADYSAQSQQQVILNNQGLWSATQTLRFSANNVVSYGRKIDESAEEMIQVTSIDDYVQANNVKPTFIKLDVEGAEMQALIGAKATISQLKPKLAISLYHAQTDLWRLPLYIKSLNPNYRFYLG